MICGYCYKTGIPETHDVSHWWNCSPDTDYVCSDECYTKLEKLVKDGTWMDHKPEAIFGKKKRKPSPNFGAITDKQFTSDLG